MKKTICLAAALAVVFIMVAAQGVFARGGSDQKAPGGYTITLVSPQVGNAWWQICQKGFMDKCNELGIKGIVTGGDDHSVQRHIEAMETVLTQKPDAVITMAIEEGAYTNILTQYKNANIPVVTFAADTNRPDLRVAYVGWDYAMIGEQEIKDIIKAVKKLSNDVPKLGVLVNNLDQTTHMIRPEVYQKYMDANCPGGKVVAVEPTHGDSVRGADLLVQLTQAHPEMNSLICVEGESTPALGKVFKELNLAGKNFALFGNGDQAESLNAIRDGAYGVEAYDCYNAAGRTVEVMLSYLKGEKVESNYFVPGVMVTAENLEATEKAYGFK
jgi:ABC-type sugar transport system substrate-binding protein